MQAILNHPELRVNFVRIDLAAVSTLFAVLQDDRVSVLVEAVPSPHLEPTRNVRKHGTAHIVLPDGIHVLFVGVQAVIPMLVDPLQPHHRRRALPHDAPSNLYHQILPQITEPVGADPLVLKPMHKPLSTMHIDRVHNTERERESTCFRAH